MSTSVYKVRCPSNPMVDNDVHRINLYTMDNPIGFPITYPLDSDLCDGQRYSKFKQPGPELKQQTQKLLKQSMRYAKISDKITDNSDFTASNSKLNKLYLKTLKRVMLTFPGATLESKH